MASIACRDPGHQLTNARKAQTIPRVSRLLFSAMRFTGDVKSKKGSSMSFSNHLRKLATPIWDAQLIHPFVVALGKGTLPERKFKYYILQDARFLGDLARVFSAGALKVPDSGSALRLADDKAGGGNYIC